MTFRTTRFVFFREEAGILGPVPMWVFVDRIYGYLYMSESFFGLVKQCWQEWRDDRHLVG